MIQMQYLKTIELTSDQSKTLIDLRTKCSKLEKECSEAKKKLDACFFGITGGISQHSGSFANYFTQDYEIATINEDFTKIFVFVQKTQA